MTTTAPTYAAIRQGMERAFFASAYADLADEVGEPLRGEIMDQLPTETDPAAVEAAHNLCVKLIDYWNFGEPGQSLAAKVCILYLKAARLPKPERADRELTPDLFGHYLAMQAMGSGVGLESFGAAVRELIPVPYVGFDSGCLTRCYFEQEGERHCESCGADLGTDPNAFCGDCGGDQ